MGIRKTIITYCFILAVVLSGLTLSTPARADAVGACFIHFEVIMPGGNGPASPSLTIKNVNYEFDLVYYEDILVCEAYNYWACNGNYEAFRNRTQLNYPGAVLFPYIFAQCFHSEDDVPDPIDTPISEYEPVPNYPFLNFKPVDISPPLLKRISPDFKPEIPPSIHPRQWYPSPLPPNLSPVSTPDGLPILLWIAVIIVAIILLVILVIESVPVAIAAVVALLLGIVIPTPSPMPQETPMTISGNLHEGRTVQASTFSAFGKVSKDHRSFSGKMQLEGQVIQFLVDEDAVKLEATDNKGKTKSAHYSIAHLQDSDWYVWTQSLLKPLFMDE